MIVSAGSILLTGSFLPSTITGKVYLFMTKKTVKICIAVFILFAWSLVFIYPKAVSAEEPSDSLIRVVSIDIQQPVCVGAKPVIDECREGSRPAPAG